jgi:hypothetical protein
MRTAYAAIVPFGLASVLSTLYMYASPHWATIANGKVFVGTAGMPNRFDGTRALDRRRDKLTTTWRITDSIRS